MLAFQVPSLAQMYFSIWTIKCEKAVLSALQETKKIALTALIEAIELKLFDAERPHSESSLECQRRQQGTQYLEAIQLDRRDLLESLAPRRRHES